MPKKTTNSGLLKKMGSRGQKAFDAHKGDDTKFSAAGELPAGIEGGIAKLVDCKISKYEKGDQKGELFFYAAGIIVSPVEHNSQRVEGLRTSIMEPLCETPTRSRKTFDDHLDWMLNQLRMLTLDTGELDFDNLEDALDVLKDAGVHFRFRTWQGEPTDQYPNPRVNHQWNGQIDYAETDDDDGVVDGTSEEPPVEQTQSADPDDLDALAVAADEGDDDAVSTLTEKATLLDITQDQLDETPSWADVVELIENAEKSEKGAEEAFPTFTELGTLADDNDDEEAKTSLTNAAEARQLDPDEYPSWLELAEELETAPVVKLEKANQPDKGDVWYYKPPGKRKLVECEVTAIFEKSEACNLKNLDDGSSYKSVKWSDLSVEG